MTEGEAKAWIADRFGDAAVDRLAVFAALLLEENGRQNLVSPSTLATIWSRHLADSAQLLDWGSCDGLWLDVGSGGGLPGIVLALLTDRAFILCEPRALRAAFLSRCVDVLDLAPRVRVEARKVEAISAAASTISARAVASIDRLFDAAKHCASAGTIWVLPRGQSACDDVQGLTMRRVGSFHVKQSVTSSGAGIVVATGIGRR